MENWILIKTGGGTKWDRNFRRFIKKGKGNSEKGWGGYPPLWSKQKRTTGKGARGTAKGSLKKGTGANRKKWKKNNNGGGDKFAITSHSGVWIKGELHKQGGGERFMGRGKTVPKSKKTIPWSSGARLYCGFS